MLSPLVIDKFKQLDSSLVILVSCISEANECPALNLLFSIIKKTWNHHPLRIVDTLITFSLVLRVAGVKALPIRHCRGPVRSHLCLGQTGTLWSENSGLF